MTDTPDSYRAAWFSAAERASRERVRAEAAERRLSEIEAQVRDVVADLLADRQQVLRDGGSCWCGGLDEDVERMARVTEQVRSILSDAAAPEAIADLCCEHHDCTAPTDEQAVTADRETPDDGHTFRLVFDIRPSSAVVGEPLSDGPAFMGPAHVIEVRAWNLTDALVKASRLPFAVKTAHGWGDGAMADEQTIREGVAQSIEAEAAYRSGEINYTPDYRDGLRGAARIARGVP